MGCLGRLGCLVLLALLAAGAWFTRDTWMKKLRRGATPAGDVAAETWQPLTPEGARRARTALQRLESAKGPVFANVAPGDLAAYIMQELSNTLPSSADSIRAAAIGDRLYLRASVKTADLGDAGALGPFAALLGERETIQLGGVLHILRPGLGEFQVKELKLRDFALPPPLIPRLIRQISRGERPAGLAADALPLRTPNYIADVRVARGKITLYKTVPAR